MHDDPPLIDLLAIRALRESTTPWQMGVRPAPANTDRSGTHRLLIIVSAGANTIRFMAPSARPFTDAMLAHALEQAMLQRGADLEPARPPAVVVDDESLRAAIELPMSACGVEVRLEERLPAIDPVVEALAGHEDLFADDFDDEIVEGSLPALLPPGHTVALEMVDAAALDPLTTSATRSPCLVVRVAREALASACGALAEIDALTLIPREIDGRDAEILVGLAEGRPVGVVSALGITHDHPSLHAELDEAGLGAAGSLTVVVVPAEDPIGADRVAMIAQVALFL